MDVNLKDGYSRPLSETGPLDTTYDDTFISIENYYQKGTNGANIYLTGTDFNNILRTSLGDDIIFGGDGNDIIYGNDGNDTLYAGSGDDKLYGGSGDDILVLNGVGDQVFDGGEGNDTIQVDLSDYVANEENSPFVYKIDLTTGFSGSRDNPDAKNNDDLISIENIDLLGRYDAEIKGDQNDNFIQSGSGDDIINSGSGNDRIDGGKGNDIFVQDGLSSDWTVNYIENWQSANSTSETINYTVTVGPKTDGSGNTFYINGEQHPNIEFKEGNTYVFDLSSATVTNNSFKLSTSSDGTHNSGLEFTENVTTFGTPGR